MALVKIWLIGCYLINLSALAAPGESVCGRWPEPNLALGDTLCVTVRPADDTVPLYHQKSGGEEFWFRFDADSLALVVDSRTALDALAQNPARQAELLSVLKKNRLAFWHQDALYWSKWLETSNW